MKLHITESPEWNRLYWAVMAIAAWVILSSLFSCTPEPTSCIKDYLAEYWFLWALPQALFYWMYRRFKSTLPKAIFGFLSLICFVLLAAPYLMMFGLWVILQLF